MSKLLIILAVLICVQTSFGQDRNVLLDRIPGMKNPDVTDDEGHWFGLRFGTQTKPKYLKRNWKYSEWWTFILMYEYRFDRTVSLLVEYHHFNEKFSLDIEKFAVEIGLKMRFHILSNLRISAEGEIGLGDIAPSMILFYGGSIEFDINYKMSTYFNIKTTIISDHGYWLTIGVNYNLSVL